VSFLLYERYSEVVNRTESLRQHGMLHYDQDVPGKRRNMGLLLYKRYNKKVKRTEHDWHGAVATPLHGGEWLLSRAMVVVGAISRRICISDILELALGCFVPKIETCQKLMYVMQVKMSIHLNVYEFNQS
jgi:hypothetical protein